MTAFQGASLILMGVFLTTLFLALSSLSQLAARYVEAYELVVDAAVSPKEAVAPTGDTEATGETLEVGVYHTTPQDIQEYFKGRTRLDSEANKRPRSWDYTDDEYEGFEPTARRL